MIVDYKYHIASLVAVFLALGIGILIGSTLLGNTALVEYQKQVTNNLENQLQTLRKTNEDITARANTLQLDTNISKQYEDQTLPMLVDGRLAGKTFAVIELNGYGFPPEITEVIEDAGGTISSVTSINNFYDEQKDLKDLREELGLWPDLSDDEYLGKLGTEIAVGIIDGEKDSIVNSLIDKKILQSTGKFGIPVDGVIIIGGSYKRQARNMQIDLALIDYFKELNIPVVGVEETDVSSSSMKEYQRKHISTIDDIDSAPGRLAMVLVLGGQPGNYGVKSTAQKLLPDLKKQEVK
ncbi:copper transporter [Desulfotruncus alcoholivorax]|uniref:copper transporter n=1 Tax=Desulfotruncus alcoholivorax TaxID=265477 RepID=UPI00040A0336|nr:copper transporter [Desulfotruncus alcoholivorax]